jgi:hypothetical protein
MLLDQLLLGDGQLVAEEEILEGILVEDVPHVEGVVVRVEIKAVFARAEAVPRLALPVESAERLPRVGEIGRFQGADGLDDGKLRKLIEPVQLPKGLL